jgi:hypothetical protein
MKKILARAAVILLAAGSALVAGGGASAQAYGGDGTMDVWQIGLSFNCNNKAFCGNENLGGFWGWAELDHDPATGANTGDAQFAFCAHGQFSGAGHESVDVLNWWVAPGSAGPNTLFTDEVDTTMFRGQTDVETVYGADSGVALVPGHQSTAEIFGVQMPAGVVAQVQVAYKPAH